MNLKLIPLLLAGAAMLFTLPTSAQAFGGKWHKHHKHHHRHHHHHHHHFKK